jgi:hypothetical protein
MRPSVFRGRGFRHQTFFHEILDDTTEITFIDQDIRPDLFCRAVFDIVDLVQDPPLRERVWGIEEMLIEQPDHICIISIKAPDFFNPLPVTLHAGIKSKILDFVKYLPLLIQTRDEDCPILASSLKLCQGGVCKNANSKNINLWKIGRRSYTILDAS